MMIKTGFYLLQIIVLSLIVSCSGSDSEDTSEKGSLKKTQDKIAQEAVDYIKVPLDKAKEARTAYYPHIKAGHFLINNAYLIHEITKSNKTYTIPGHKY